MLAVLQEQRVPREERELEAQQRLQQMASVREGGAEEHPCEAEEALAALL